MAHLDITKSCMPPYATPRTDKLCENFTIDYSPYAAKFALIELARQLERELAQAVIEKYKP